MPDKPKQSKKRGSEDVLVRVDKITADLIQKLSEQMNTSIRDTVRLLSWLGKKSVGRKVMIKEGESVLEVSLEEYHTIEELQLEDNVPDAK